MLYPEIKDYHSADVENVWLWKPNDADDVFFNLEITIGSKDSDSGDIFEVMVATPEGVKRHAGKISTIISSKLIIVVDNYRWDSVFHYCEKLVADCYSETWEGVVYKLSRFFTWEYEDEKIGRARYL